MFEVIDLINRDYPRGGIAQPGLTAGTCLRKDFTFSEERSHAPGMLLAVSRVNESVPLFLVEGLKRRLGTRCADRKVAVLGLSFKRDSDDERDSLAHKLIRLLERELADVAVHDPHVRTPDRRSRTPCASADAVIVATNHAEFRRDGDAAHDRRARRAGLPGRRPLELLRRRAGVRLRHRGRSRSRARPAPGASRAREPRPRDRRRRDDRRRRRPAPAARSRPRRCASPTSARRPQWMREGCEVHTGDLRELDEARRRDGRLHARDPPGGDRRRHRQLPQAAPHADRGEQRALQRASSARRSTAQVERFVYVSSLDGLRARGPSSPPPEEYLADCPIPRSAYGFSKLTGEVYCRAAHDEHGLPYTICRPFNAYGPGEMPDAEPGIAHAVPDLIRKVLSGQRPLQIFGVGRADAHAHPRGRHRRRHRDRHGLSRRAERGLQHLRLATS